MAILKNAANADTCTHRIKFKKSARAAWQEIIASARIQGRSSILLPGYIGITEREGSGIFDPVENTGSSYAFYPLDDKLAPDYVQIEAMLATREFSMLLAVHYFGVVAIDLPRLKALCVRFGTLLIEDCAHVSGLLLEATSKGSIGDAAFYSLHKAIAVSEGGMLRVNSPAAFDIDFLQSDCPQQVVEQLCRTDMAAINAKRQENYRWLAERLAGVVGITVLYPEIGETVPHDFPLLVHDGLREKLYFKLMEQGLPTVALYYRMLDQIAGDAFPTSHRIAASILNLPVHQDTDRADLEVLADALERALATLR